LPDVRSSLGAWVRASQQQWDEARVVACSYCHAAAGRHCVSVSPRWGVQPAAQPHKRRVQLALAVRAHADPLLDAQFPHYGACELCGVPGLGARHRVIDAVAAQLEAGGIWEEISAEMDVTREAIEAVRSWMVRWPGAWL
jgi:hypothetical protein